MGQSVASRSAAASPYADADFVKFSVFETAFGWIGLVGRNQVVRQLRLGYPDPRSLIADLQSAGVRADLERATDWHPQLREMLRSYAEGKAVSFLGVRFQLPPMTPFQQIVLRYVRTIPFGQVTTYGEVARLVGHSGAGRAVGTVMANNPLPIIIPCHRVVAAGGKLGGYSSPRGVELKQWLLDLERNALPIKPR